LGSRQSKTSFTKNKNSKITLPLFLPFFPFDDLDSIFVLYFKLNLIRIENEIL